MTLGEFPLCLVGADKRINTKSKQSYTNKKMKSNCTYHKFVDKRLSFVQSSGTAASVPELNMSAPEK